MEEGQIIREVLNGDTQAYAVLVHRYERPIYNLMLRMTANREQAADLAQDTFLKAYEKLPTFNVRRGFFPWVYTIGINLARDWLRREKMAGACLEQLAEAAGRPAGTAEGSEQTLADQIDGHRLRACMMQLPEAYREALILRYHEGLPVQEVGQALGISVSGAKMRVARGMEKLRGLFEQPRKSANPVDAPVAKESTDP